jgi:hypothetical protein
MDVKQSGEAAHAKRCEALADIAIWVAKSTDWLAR